MNKREFEKVLKCIISLIILSWFHPVMANDKLDYRGRLLVDSVSVDVENAADPNAVSINSDEDCGTPWGIFGLFLITIMVLWLVSSNRNLNPSNSYQDIIGDDEDVNDNV